MKEPVVSMTLDLQKASEDTVVSLKQGNTVGKLAICLSEDGFPYEIAEDCYAVLAATKPDGTLLYNRCLVEGNTVFYEITEQTTAAPGRILAEVRLYGKEDQLVTTASFCMAVQETVCDDEIVESAGEVSALTHLISQTLEVEQRSGELLSLADTVEKAAAEAMTLAAEAAGRIADAVSNANAAADRADKFPLVADAAKQKAEEANAKVDTLREVVSKFHSNIQETAKGEVITVSDASDLPLAGLKVFGKTEQNGIPTPEAPVPLESVGDSVNVTVCGKNLMQGFNGTENNPFTITASADDHIEVLHNTYAMLTAGKTYTFSIYSDASYGSTAGTDTVEWYLLKDIGYTNLVPPGGSVQNGNRISKTFNIEATGKYYLRLDVNAVGKTHRFWNAQIEEYSEATAYEPYKGQTLTAQTPNGLPGIPVESGGNYTDNTGKQWICDEVDFEKGVYVQRVNLVELENFIFEYNSDTSGQALCKAMFDLPSNADDLLVKHGAICDKLPELPYSYINGTPGSWFGIYRDGVRVTVEGAATVEAVNERLGKITLAYPLEKAIYYQLSEIDPDALAQYAALHSNYPNTTVFNDAGAEMEVKYEADTKLYIDRKFNELAAALVSNV